MASAWKVEFSREAERELDDVLNELGEGAYYEMLQDAIDLEEDPTPAGSLHMRGSKDYYRIYTYRSMYRIVYRVLFGRRTVRVLRVGPRGNVYSGFDRW